jgi:hypothetical protein
VAIKTIYSLDYNVEMAMLSIYPHRIKTTQCQKNSCRFLPPQEPPQHLLKRIGEKDGRWRKM